MTEFVISVARSPLTLMRRLYDWTICWARNKKAPYALFGIAFMESSFFPVPPDTLLIPMVVSDRSKWFRYVLICTAGSVLGGLCGYAIGWGLFETIGRPIVEFYDMQHAVEMVAQKYGENAFLTVFAAAFTPLPYKAITITAGLFEISIPLLVIASLFGRAGRFFLVAGALRIFGDKIQNSIERYFDIFSIGCIVLLIGGFIAFKYLM